MCSEFVYANTKRESGSQKMPFFFYLRQFTSPDGSSQDPLSCVCSSNALMRQEFNLHSMKLEKSCQKDAATLLHQICPGIKVFTY